MRKLGCSVRQKPFFFFFPFFLILEHVVNALIYFKHPGQVQTARCFPCTLMRNSLERVPCSKWFMAAVQLLADQNAA